MTPAKVAQRAPIARDKRQDRYGWLVDGLPDLRVLRLKQRSRGGDGYRLAHIAGRKVYPGSKPFGCEPHSVNHMA